jgi:DNA-binding GntR family transcriptional regulator
VTVADFVGNFDQVYRLRAALECLAVELAVSRISTRRANELIVLADALGQAKTAEERQAAHLTFHQVLYASSDFPALVEMIELIWARFPWHRVLVLPTATGHRDHREIAELAAKGDAKGAAERLRVHFDTVREGLQARMQELNEAEGEPGASPPEGA